VVVVRERIAAAFPASGLSSGVEAFRPDCLRSSASAAALSWAVGGLGPLRMPAGCNSYVYVREGGLSEAAQEGRRPEWQSTSMYILWSTQCGFSAPRGLHKV